MGTPADVLPESIVYFRTYFAGSMGVVMYNIFVGVLQSVGDGRHPLIYLIISSCVNVVLDIFFIAGLGMGVGSAALATAISQFVSALLCMVHLLRVEEEYRLELREIRFDSSMLKQIIQNGVPSGFQNSVIAIANVFVQSNINAFWKNGDGRMWFLLQDRGIRLFAGDLFYNGSDNLCQSESGCKTV